MRTTARSKRDIVKRLLEVNDNSVPGKGFRDLPRRGPEQPGEPRLTRHAYRGGDECSLVAERRKQRRALVLEVLARRSVVVRDDAEAARHRLQGHVAEGLGHARKEEDIGRRIMR